MTGQGVKPPLSESSAGGRCADPGRAVVDSPLSLSGSSSFAVTTRSVCTSRRLTGVRVPARNR